MKRDFIKHALHLPWTLIIPILLSMCGCSVMAPRRADTGGKPLIGISCGLSKGTIHNRDAVSYAGTNTLAGAYVEAVARGGGIPVIIPSVRDTALALQILSSLDAIIFSGGEDIDPHRYGEEVLEGGNVAVNSPRDTSDLLLVSLALRHKVPILGICRGMQLLNVALGGTLYQDLPSQRPSATMHRQKEAGNEATHRVRIVGESALAGSLRNMAGGKDLLDVNSFHHQAVKDMGKGLTAVCLSEEDGIVEGFCNSPSSGLGTVLGVQFHPEKFIEHGIIPYCGIIKALVASTGTHK